jgi:L-lysine exporter family protein LysE/ArgO
MNPSVFGTGFVLACTLLVAIGAQNAFVLRQGLRREHVFSIALACSLFDLVLEAAGIGGLGVAVKNNPDLGIWFGAGGAVFLFSYGVYAWRRALKPGALHSQNDGAALDLRKALVQAAAFTFLNPHVYLDTVVLIGSVGAGQPAGTGPSFLFGAASASAIWFFGLAYGARLLAPIFERPAAWRVLDAVVGLTMFVLAFALGLDAFDAYMKTLHP